MTDAVIGAGVTRVSSEEQFDLGTVVASPTAEYVSVKYTTATDAGEVVILDTEHNAQPVTTTLAAAGFGQRIGICVAGAEANEYGWALVRGDMRIEVAASCAANVQLYATSTAGRIDDASTTDGGLANIILTTAAGGSSGRVAGRLLNPKAGVPAGMGGGGGGGFDPVEINSTLVAITIVTANRLYTTGITIPTTGWGIIRSYQPTSNWSQSWNIVDYAILTSRTAAVNGATAADANSIRLPAGQNRGVYYGRTSANALLAGSTHNQDPLNIMAYTL